MFKAWLRAYEVRLDVCLKHRFGVLLMMLGTLAGTVWLYIVIPKGFFPVEDTGFIQATIEGPSDISFPAMVERARQIAKVVHKDPAVDYFNLTVGGGRPNPTNNYGRLFVALKPRAERGINSAEVIQRLAGRPIHSRAWPPTGKTSRTSTLPAAFQKVSSNPRCSRAISRPSTGSDRRCWRRYPSLRDCATSPAISTLSIRR
jgi:multidrug efflux pump subunit AcrB